MVFQPQIILDANILMRAILGEHTQKLIERYSHACLFLTPEHCAEEAEHHLVLLMKKRGLEVQPAKDALEALFKIVQQVPREAYAKHKNAALKRIAHRDPQDWPLVALSLLLECPIWTEDGDFFGIGIATWQTRNIEIYLGSE